MIRLTVNGVPHDVSPDDDEPLLWTLRDRLGLTGAKFGCGAGLCGACTVIVDGAAQRACSLRTIDALEATIITIENSTDSVVARVRAAWEAHQVPQCGYCQPGFIMATVAILKADPNAAPEAIMDGLTNLCRCGSYNRMRAAIRSLAEA